MTHAILAVVSVFAQEHQIPSLEVRPPACLDQLALPKYHPLARQARVQGEVILKFSVDASGQPTGIETEGHKLLVTEVVRSVDGVTFHRNQCANRKFTVRYQFVIDGAVKPGAVFVPPSGFRIAVRPEPLQIQYSNNFPDAACLRPLIDKLVYPPLARQAMVQGQVEIVFRLNAAGAIQQSEHSGHKLLAEGIVMQARGALFNVTQCSTRVPVTVLFRLEDPESYDGKSTVVLREPGFVVVAAHKPAPVIN